jgi:Ca2+-binding RTX toxin-like protein
LTLQPGRVNAATTRAATLESLEPRQLLSGTAKLVRDQVLITGSNGANNIRITRNAHTPNLRYTVIIDGAYSNFFIRQVHSFKIVALGGNDRISVDSSHGSLRALRMIDAGSGEDTVSCGGSGIDKVSGGDDDDVISTGADNDVVDAGAGDDTVSAGSGNDFVNGGIGNDSLIGGDGNDTLLGGDGSDSLSGNSGGDSMDGGAGDDTLLGADGHDIMFGGSGDDYLDGAGDTDYIYGGMGDDTLFGQSGNDVLAGDEEDVLPTSSMSPPGAAAAGNDNLIGGPGDDILLAQFGKDFLIGSSGTDVFDARGSDDTLVDRTNSESIPAREVYVGTPAVNKDVRLTILVHNQRVLLNTSAGRLSGGTSLARVVATNSDGSATVRFSDLVNRHFMLGEFFRAWGITIDPTHIGRYFGSHAAPMKMTVNGASNSSFANYRIVGGENIVITCG